MINRVILMLVVLVATTATGCKKKAAPVTPPPQAVIAAPVIVRDQKLFTESIGQTRGSQEVEVRARVDGIIEAIHFEEGRFVKSGDLLYTLDAEPYVAKLNQARGQLARAEASWTKAKQDLARYQPLIEKNAISRQQYDEAVANERANAAAVDAAKADVDAAQIQVSYTQISAPASGLIGKSEVQMGNLVGRSMTTPLAEISKIDPIHVRFSVSEKEFLEYQRAHPSAGEQKEAAKDVFELILADGSVHPFRGSPVFADRQVDPTTGTLLIEAAFPNTDNQVRPGQFARVRYSTATRTNAVLVPQRAVSTLQSVNTVIVVRDDNTAEFRPVQAGRRVGSLWLIDSGLRPDEKIVVEGAQKLRPGTPLAPVWTNLTAEASE